MNRNRADYFHFGDAYEQAILKAIEQHLDIVEEIAGGDAQMFRQMQEARQDVYSDSRGGSDGGGQ